MKTIGEKWEAPHIEHSEKIDVSPSELRAIKDIGQWEMLSIQTEEMVESSKSSLFGSSQIVAIYTGTLRLGLDLTHLSDHWFESVGDTAKLILPKIKLLDPDFIDETDTRVFYETGHWTAQEKENLYKKAQKQMMRRCLTPANFISAKQNASKQISKLFFNFGFKYVIINYK